MCHTQAFCRPPLSVVRRRKKGEGGEGRKARKGIGKGKGAFLNSPAPSPFFPPFLSSSSHVIRISLTVVLTQTNDFAMESLLKNLQKHVTCSICLDMFTEPKTIACLHTFCLKCLEKHAQTSSRDGKFRCPECQAEVAVPEGLRFDKLPTGFHQNSLLGLLAVQQSGDGREISCSSCRKKSAETSFCFECGRFMCPDCVNAHELLRNVAFDGHKVRPIRNFKTDDYEALLKRKSFCHEPYHEREVLRFFCLACQSCVCQVCVITDHRDHRVEPLDKTADAEKAKIMTGVDLMKQKSQVCRDVIRQFEQTVIDLERNVTAAKREVSHAAEQMIAKIRERERDAITALEDTRVLRTEKLNSVKTQVQSLAKQINQAVEFADNLVQRSSSSGIMENKPYLQQRFADLNKTQVPSVQVSPYVKFVPTCTPENLILGIIEPIVHGLTQDFQAGLESSIVICPKVNIDVQDKDKKFQAEVIVEPAELVGSLMTRGCEDGTRFVVRFTPKVSGVYNVSVKINGKVLPDSPFTVPVRDRKFHMLGEFDLKQLEDLQGPFRIAVSRDGLVAVADCDGHCILVFDKKGQFLRKFGHKGKNRGELHAPAGVTFFNDDKILVTDYLNHRVQLFNVYTGSCELSFGRYGKEIGDLHNPESVCVDDEGRVAIADCFNNRMQVFTVDGQPLFIFGDRGSGKLNRPSGCVFHNKRFIVSDTWNHCLKIFDHSGKFLGRIGEQGQGVGHFNWPQGLCLDKQGNHYNILVCDSGNGRIVQLTMDGFFTGKTATKLQDPIAIARTPDGPVLVSDYESKKIYILK